MPSSNRAVIPVVAEEDFDFYFDGLRHQHRNVRDGQCDIGCEEPIVQALLCRWNRCGELLARNGVFGIGIIHQLILDRREIAISLGNGGKAFSGEVRRFCHKYD